MGLSVRVSISWRKARVIGNSSFRASISSTSICNQRIGGSELANMYLCKQQYQHKYMYADDTQVYIELSQSDTHKLISSLSDCLTDISLWMKSSKLKLNSNKTEFIIFGTKQQRHKLSNHFPVKLLDNDISPSDSVRNLGVIFDSDFSFHKHISNICKSCFYHIRDLRRIRRHLPLSTAKTISNSLITSRLDYCNSLINNIAKQDLSKLPCTCCTEGTSFLTITSPA